MDDTNTSGLLYLQDKIYACRSHKKALEIILDKKTFRYDCIPPRKEEASRFLVKYAILALFLTAIVGGLWACMIICFVGIVKSGEPGTVLDGIILLLTIPLSLGGGYYYVRLWIRIIRTFAYIADLKMQRKELKSDMDSLSQQLAELNDEIDTYAKALAEKEASYTDFDIDLETAELDYKALKAYMVKTFGMNPKIIKRAIRVEVLFELQRFGYRTIKDIDNDLQSMSEDYYMQADCTDYVGVLRNLMILKDCEKYFNVAYYGTWKSIPKAQVDFWKEKGADTVEKYLLEKDIVITF